LIYLVGLVAGIPAAYLLLLAAKIWRSPRRVAAVRPGRAGPTCVPTLPVGLRPAVGSSSISSRGPAASEQATARGLYYDRGVV